MVGLSVVSTLLGLLAVVAAVVGVLAARHRLAFRIAMRNVRRGRGRTALLIAGLLVGTTIIGGSLVVGDTVHQLSVHYTLLGVGFVDEAIYGNSSTGGFAYVPYSVYNQTVALTAGYAPIAGIAPELLGAGAAYDTRTGIPETNLNLIGVNGNQSTALGSFVSENGSDLSGALPGHVLIDEQTAVALNAMVGDTLLLFGAPGVAHPFIVQAIVQENIRGAFQTAGLSPGNLFVDLTGAQTIENVSGVVNYLAITNAGSQQDGATSSDAVSAYLNSTLAPVLSAHGLSVHQPLADALRIANEGAQSLLSIFLVLGLFSIVAGAMLIVGIFVMLAEERKGEMGMLRAIGLRRRELVYSYLFEGTAYAAGSALAGTGLGVAVGYVLVYFSGIILSAEGIPTSALLSSFTVSGQSLVIAYVAGFLLTLVTVVVACRRASRLNIVRAIRDIPEPRPPVRTYTFLAYLGGVAAVLGAWLLATTGRGSTDISYPILGGALIILGGGLIAARFLKNRPVFTTVGVALFVWSGWEPLHTLLLGSSHTGGIFVVLVDGILMVGGILTAFLFNADLLASVLQRLFGGRARSSPVVRLGLAYPTRQPTRTIVSLAIFALVVFTMVATASFGATVEANLESTVATESGGYSFFGYSQTPIPNMPAIVANNSTLSSQFATTVPVVTGAVEVTVGSGSLSYTDSLFSAPTNVSAASSFYATNQFPFRSTLGNEGAAATFGRIANGSGYAIVDSTYAAAAGFGSSGGPSHPIVAVGDSITLTRPRSGLNSTVIVAGILKESILNGVWVSPGTAAHLGETNESFYFLTVRPGVSTIHAAQVAKVAFFRQNLVLFDIHSLLATSISTTQGFIGLLEIFVGLGLAVGIAAMGILALRAVVERRREIGMLRASGFTERMVLKTFLLEYSFVTVLGVGIGAVLGVLIVYNLSLSPSAADSGVATFSAPWVTVIEIVLVAYLLVVAAILLPSIRAARLPPAEAVRATE